MIHSGDTWAKSFTHYIVLCPAIDGRPRHLWMQVIDELPSEDFHKERARTPAETIVRRGRDQSRSRSPPMIRPSISSAVRRVVAHETPTGMAKQEDIIFQYGIKPPQWSDDVIKCRNLWYVPTAMPATGTHVWNLETSRWRSPTAWFSPQSIAGRRGMLAPTSAQVQMIHQKIVFRSA